MQSSDTSESESGPKRPKRAKTEPELGSEKRLHNIFMQVWTHFQRIDDYLAYCSYCQQVVFYKTSAWYLVEHMKITHQNFKNENSDEQIHIKIENTDDANEWIDSPPSLPINVKIDPEQQKKTDRDLLELFINDYHPFSIVEERAFKKFANNIPGYTLPDTESIASVQIPNLYEETLSKLKELVTNEALSICLTVDLWAAASKERYLAVTAHFIDKEFNQRHILLTCTGIEGERPNKAKICNELKKLIESWNLRSKIVLVMADKCENIEQSIEAMSWDMYQCYYYAINSVFMRVIKEMTIYAKIKKIIFNFNMSSLSSNMLQSYQQHNMAHSVPKTFIQDNLNCWISIYDMIQRFVELREAIQACTDRVGKHWPVIADWEWETAEQICEVLSLFKQVMILITKDQFAPSSIVIEVTNNLISVCDTFLEKEFFNELQLDVKDVIRNIKDGLTKIPDVEANMTLSVCTLLDPRYKTVPFKNKQKLKELKSHTRELIVNVIDKRNLAFIKSEPNVEASMTWEKLRESPALVAVQEMESYLNNTILPERNSDGQWNDPAQWWRDHKSTYPNLAQVYRTKCHAVATNIRSEEHFSKAGLRNLKRYNLNIHMIEKLAFLNANLDPKRFD